MARPSNSPILAQLRNAKTLPEQATALQALKNEIVGHVEKKEAWIELGVLEVIVKTLGPNGSPRKASGKDPDIQRSPPLLSDEQSVRLQALQLVASFANGGPAFLSPLHAARIVPAILTSVSPYTNPPQIVLASLQALVDISAATSLAHPSASTQFDIQKLADEVLTVSATESINAILSVSLSQHLYPSQVRLVSLLICRICREDRHQQALVTAGVLDSLAAQLARFAVADGVVELGAKDLAMRDGLGHIFPEPAKTSSRIGPLLEAISCIIGDSRYRACRLTYSPAFLAVFPSISIRLAEPCKDSDDSSQPQSSLAAVERILSSLPTPNAKAPFAAQSAFPTPDRAADSRTRSRTSSAKLAAGAAQQADTSSSSAKQSESPLILWLIRLVRGLDDYDRLMAAAVLAALLKADLGLKGIRETTVGLLVVPILVDMIAKYEKLDKRGVDESNPSQANHRLILEKGPAVLARLIMDNDYLIKAAVDSEAEKVLVKLLKRSHEPLAGEGFPPVTWSPHPRKRIDPENTSPLARLGEGGLNPLLVHRIGMRESSLKAIGALSSAREDYRKALVAQDVVPYVVQSLEEDRTPKGKYGHNPTAVIIAACHVVRTLARSVSVLRTALVDNDVAMPILRFLRYPDTNIQIAASATVINLVVEVSPVRELLTKSGVMQSLCELAHCDNRVLRGNAFWALKHFVDAGAPDLKKACLAQLDPGWLVQVITGTTEDLDEDMGIQVTDEPLRWLYGHDGQVHQLDPSQSSRLRQIHERLNAIRDSELTPSRRARIDDLTIQEQGLDFIRNFIGRPEPAIAADASRETTDMIDHLLSEIGQDRLFEILLSKLRSRLLGPYSRRDRTAGREARLLHPPARTVVAVVYILVHMAASIPRHRQLVIAQTELLKQLALQASSRDRGVRTALCHLIINLTWQDDESEVVACSQRVQELKRLGFHTKMGHLSVQDGDLDVRERAKTAAWQLEQATK
ncbi:hypothetical protein E4U37_002674 [Claviceps purpurea]|nr:hypothetical protein E4U37_002674 [Claviceps purpurea]